MFQCFPYVYFRYSLSHFLLDFPSFSFLTIVNSSVKMIFLFLSVSLFFSSSVSLPFHMHFSSGFTFFQTRSTGNNIECHFLLSPSCPCFVPPSLPFCFVFHFPMTYNLSSLSSSSLSLREILCQPKSFQVACFLAHVDHMLILFCCILMCKWASTQETNLLEEDMFGTDTIPQMRVTRKYLVTRSFCIFFLKMSGFQNAIFPIPISKESNEFEFRTRKYKDQEVRIHMHKSLEMNPRSALKQRKEIILIVP